MSGLAESSKSPPTPPDNSQSPPSNSSPPPSSSSSSSTPGTSNSPPPPDSSSSSPPSPTSPSGSTSSPPPRSPPSPPPSSNTSPPSPPSNSASPHPVSPSVPSPPSSSDPPKPSPPSHLYSAPPSPSHNTSLPPPPPAAISPPTSPVHPSPPQPWAPPLAENSPPPLVESLPVPSPSSGSSSSPLSPPAQTIPPPLRGPSPPVPNPPNLPPRRTNPNPTPSTNPPHPSTPSPPPPPRSSNHASDLSPPSTNSSRSSSSPQSSNLPGSSGSVVGVTVAGVLIIAMAAIFFMVSRRRKRRAEAFAAHYRPPNSYSAKSDGYYYGQQVNIGTTGPPEMYFSSKPPLSPNAVGNSYGSHMYHTGTPETNVIGSIKSYFSYEEVMEITSGFSNQNIIGEGGFGCVYKGYLPDGKVVAVKQLKAGSGQGEREFRAEVEIISRVHHRHLVSLVGYCIAEHQRLLIYEFLPNKTLDHHLHGKGLPVLDWEKRLKIAVGAARGLAYLHEDCHPKIIHRDIKSENILLDDSFEAQVADFGLARLTNDTSTHVSTRVMGTFGYMAPEYASSGKLTDRSDVYSFGVVLLELITGRKPVDPSRPLGDESLVEWARPLLIRALESGGFGELTDPRLEKHFVEGEMFRMIEAAAACVRHSAPKRPRMSQVVRALDSEGELADLSNGVKLGQSTVFDSGQYNQDIQRFRRMAFGSGESAEFETYSGEYTSREVSRGPPTSSWNSLVRSSEFPSGESETRAMNECSVEAKGNFGGRRFT